MVLVLVFAANYEQACIHFAGPPVHEWKYVQNIEDVRGRTDVAILDLGGWESDSEKIEAWDLIHWLIRE